MCVYQQDYEITQEAKNLRKPHRTNSRIGTRAINMTLYHTLNLHEISQLTAEHVTVSRDQSFE